VGGDYNRGGDVVVDPLVVLPPAHSHESVHGARNGRERGGGERGGGERGGGER